MIKFGLVITRDKKEIIMSEHMKTYKVNPNLSALVGAKGLEAVFFKDNPTEMLAAYIFNKHGDIIDEFTVKAPWDEMPPCSVELWYDGVYLTTPNDEQYLAISIDPDWEWNKVPSMAV